MAKKRRSAPLRYQIRKEIIDLLTRDNYLPGDQIPTEQELMEYLDVSRSTLREGLHLLEEERVIRTKHGTGRFLVATPRDYKFDITSLSSIPELLASFNIESVDRILRVEERPADGEVSKTLDIPEESPIILIERVRNADNIPIIYSVDIFSKSLLPEDWTPADFKGSLFSYLEQHCRINLSYSQATLRVETLPDTVSTLVENNQDVWMLLDQVIYSSEGKPVIYSRDYHRTDTITFQVRRFRR